MKARIKFRKYGALRFIGHLDVMRFFQKVMRRADIPIAFTTGYSPHMIMSFANPLGIGLTSDGEYFDIELREAVNSLDVKKGRRKASFPLVLQAHAWRVPRSALAASRAFLAPACAA